MDHYYRETVALKQQQFKLQKEITMLKNDLASRSSLQLACTQELGNMKQERNWLYSELARRRVENEDEQKVSGLDDSVEGGVSYVVSVVDEDAVRNPNARDIAAVYYWFFYRSNQVYHL